MADTKPDTTSSSREPHSSSAGSMILLDMADTTWRMFVPTIGLLMLGRWLDTRYGFKPWLMLAGVALGALIAALLIRRQLTRGGHPS